MKELRIKKPLRRVLRWKGGIEGRKEVNFRVFTWEKVLRDRSPTTQRKRLFIIVKNKIEL